MQEEIDYRKLVVRPKELEAVKKPALRATSAKTSNTKPPNKTKTATKAASATWKK